jgi:hypothetical protein
MRLKYDDSDDNAQQGAEDLDLDTSETMPYFKLIYGDPTGQQQLLCKHDGFTISNNHEGFIETELPRRSLYILSGPLRYSFTHEILGLKGIPKLYSQLPLPERRVSIIFRDELPAAR